MKSGWDCILQKIHFLIIAEQLSNMTDKIVSFIHNKLLNNLYSLQYLDTPISWALTLVLRFTVTYLAVIKSIKTATMFTHVPLCSKERKWPPPMPKRPAKGRGGIMRERSLDLQDRQRQEARRRLMAAKRAASFRQNSATERADSIEIYIPEAQTRLWGPQIPPQSLLSISRGDVSSLPPAVIVFHRSSIISLSVAILWVVPTDATLGKIAAESVSIQRKLNVVLPYGGLSAPSFLSEKPGE